MGIKLPIKKKIVHTKPADPVDVELACIAAKKRAYYAANPWKIVTEIVYPELEFADFHEEWFNIQWDNKTTFIRAPRGHAKTTVCTVGYSIARLLINPNVRILIVSRTATQAQVFAADIQNRLESNEKIIAYWGKQVGSPWTNSRFTVATRTKSIKEPSVIASGVMGPLVSLHVDEHIIDDMLDFSNTRTTNIRQDTVEWVGANLNPTLDPGGFRHWLGTRYHYEDYYGTHLLKKYKRQEYVTNPNTCRAIIDEEKGKVLWPARFTTDLDEAKKGEKLDLIAQREMDGPIIFAAQYQNDAEAMRGMIIKPEYIKYYTLVENKTMVLPEGVKEPIEIEDLIKVTGTDQAISDKETADPSAFCTVGLHKKTNQLFLLPGLREARLDIHKQIEEIEKEARRYIPRQLGIEDVGFQRALYQLIDKKFRQNGLINKTKLVRVPRKDGKVTRVTLNMIPPMAAGNFYVLKGEHDDFVREMLGFTDDSSKAHRLDSVEMAVSLLLKRTFVAKAWY